MDPGESGEGKYSSFSDRRGGGGGIGERRGQYLETKRKITRGSFRKVVINLGLPNGQERGGNSSGDTLSSRNLDSEEKRLSPIHYKNYLRDEGGKIYTSLRFVGENRGSAENSTEDIYSINHFSWMDGGIKNQNP